MFLSAYIYFSAALALVYAAVQLRYLRAWRSIPVWNIPDAWRPHTRVTVIVPARNEGANIAACLRSILAGSYPSSLLEVLVVDDHSEDDTAEIVRQFTRQKMGLLRLLQMADCDDPAFFGKKKAIGWAVSQARGALIVTTDADCIAPPDWLGLLVSLYEIRRPGAIAAPVAIHRERNLLQRFQALDLAGMMGITGAGIQMGWHRMGNGANLCYPKSIFETLGGFSGNAGRASGDDLFLLQQIARRADVLFLKNTGATVLTEAPADLRGFVRQRLRWATKNTALPEVAVKMVLALVFLFCWALILHAVLSAFLPGLIWIFLGQLAFKALADYLLLSEMCHFFNRRALLSWFWPALFLHSFYIAGLGAWSLLVGTYTWKGRHLR